MTISRCLVSSLFLLLAWSVPAGAMDSPLPPSHSQRIWRMAAKEQAALEQRGAILHDASLSTYLQTVVKRLWEQVDTDLNLPTINIIMDPLAEAYAYPNGYCFLTTGMLSQIDNEDQLAMIIAHEMVHYLRQHTTELYGHYQSTNTETGLKYADGPRASGSDDIEQRINAAEYQADKEGLSILERAGYCGTEVLALLTSLIHSMQDLGRSGTAGGLRTRMEYTQAMLGPTRGRSACVSASGGGREIYLNHIAPALVANAQAAIQRADWNQADRSITAYQMLRPTDARAYYLKGEILRRRNHGDGKNQSIGYYEKALNMDPEFPPAQRALGELHFKAGRYRKAKSYFEAFLSLAPQDDAREFIKGYLRQCQD